MDSITQDAIKVLKELSKTTASVLATAEEVSYFSQALPAQKEKPVNTNFVSPFREMIKKEEVSTPSPAESTTHRHPETPSKIQIKEEVKQAPRSQLDQRIRQDIQKILPELVLRETIADDRIAKRLARVWEESYLKAQIVIIAFGEVGAGLEFLKHVTSAIDKLIAPAQLIDGLSFERESKWQLLLSSSALKKIICSPWDFWKTSTLSKNYRQNGSTGEHFLGPYPLLLLKPSHIYLKNGDQKRELWKILSMQLLS